MHTEIMARHIEVGDSLKAYVREHLEHELSKYLVGEHRAEVVFDKERGRFSASVMVRANSRVGARGEGKDV